MAGRAGTAARCGLAALLALWAAFGTRHGGAFSFPQSPTSSLRGPTLGKSWLTREEGRRCAGRLRLCAEEEDAAAAPEPQGTVVGTASSITKGMVGSGILSLPAGIAAFTRTPQGLRFAVLLLIAFTALAAYSFQLVAWVSAETGTKDFGEAWAETVGEEVAWIPRWAVMLISAISCVIYAMLLGDLLASILRGVLSVGGAAGALGSLKAGLLPYCQKGPVLVVLATFVLLPLCLQESFAGLSFISIVGLIAAAYLCGVVVLRSLDGSYLPRGRFFGLAPIRPRPLVAAKTLGDAINARSLVLLSTFGMAYMNHGMAPPTYQELQAEAPAGASEEEARSAKLKKYRVVTALSFTGAFVLCSAVMVAGFQTFGPASAGNILANYANTDLLATLARACVMVSVLGGFPLNYAVLRNELNATLESKGIRLNASKRKLMTVGILTAFVIAALNLGDLGQAQAVVGSIFGTFVVYTAPALMARAMRRKKGLKRPFQAAAEIGLLALGGVVSVVGLTLSLRG